MSEYTSTREGFERAMKWSLTGPPEEARLFFEGISTPDFYHIMNDERLEGDAYVKSIAEWRAKVTDYQPVLQDFLRDGDKLAARMTGTIKLEGADSKFESFMFAKIDKASGKMEWLVERAVWGPADSAYEQGLN